MKFENMIIKFGSSMMMETIYHHTWNLIIKDGKKV